MSKHFTMVNDIELLSTTVAKVGKDARLVLTVRLDPEDSFETCNFGLTPEQFWRLRNDLNRLAEHSDMMKSKLAEVEDRYPCYENIVLEKPVPKKQRRRRGTN